MGEPGVPPEEFRRTLHLRDGRDVTIAPLTPDDTGRLAEALRDADPQTLHARFCGAPPHVTPELLRHLTELDYVNRFALVASDPDGHGVALARYEATGEPGVAEVALAVEPQWRRAGLGSALIRMLAEAALARGFTLFTAVYLADNRAVADLLDEVHGHTTIAEGIAEATIRLT
ncbi:GNAT family N-acetyltransferase [Amycolatopsis cynarae]|uniref:GNAT family N-acetyltransferase n=1 Tax=Amycolatopsis cynarae TaxID=2995223 RepID=A0ABY7BB73_9PSEU|nr:GNAT family N-acetyltransferase [Amycolatopsis sp. HUAS 11-8]WAL68943.1 GNAT family N-acetyltransferase [Amycolatopsis sp. HUAS 11-8]